MHRSGLNFFDLPTFLYAFGHQLDPYRTPYLSAPTIVTAYVDRYKEKIQLLSLACIDHSNFVLLVFNLTNTYSLFFPFFFYRGY